MTVTYIDTSALTRSVMREGDIDLVDTTIQGECITSILTTIELRAAVYARWHRGSISERQRDGLQSVVDEDIVPSIALLPLDDTVRAEAHGIVSGYLIRTLDALHIATAVVAQRRGRRNGSAIHFCTADRRRAEVARLIFSAERVMYVSPL